MFLTRHHNVLKQHNLHRIFIYVTPRQPPENTLPILFKGNEGGSALSVSGTFIYITFLDIFVYYYCILYTYCSIITNI